MLRSAAETVALLAPLAALLACAYLQIEQSGLLTLLVGCAALAVFFCGFRGGAHYTQSLPTATLGALAAAGRILFAPIPDFKPVSAICIIAGAVFRQAQRLHGGSAGSGLCSNFFFGQGPWTPWQMPGDWWDYVAGVLATTAYLR